MGVPAAVDLALLAPGAILGLVGIWLGFQRSLVAPPMRWLIPFFGACAAAALAVLCSVMTGNLVATSELSALFYLIVGRETAAWLDGAGAVINTALPVLVFLLALPLLLGFMRNLKQRVAVWTGRRRIGLSERILGGLVGIACGLLIAALPYGLYEWTRRDQNADPAWAHESLALPYLRGATALAKRAASAYWPPSDARP